jgi:diaminohydroxyphosphoribosylaminopyrimidine deaminase/5-amino-6-(5-phosphoribosylamino)uracil reductase
MAEALELAAQGRFRVEPNPTVGAIVLDARGEIVGRGWHSGFGDAHAEIEALSEAKRRARGGTLIVTLEPCAHTEKKTPPCVPAVIKAGVARVVAGCADPNPATTGRAAAAFAEAGIEYHVGVLRDRCRAALRRYERHLGADRPWVVSKWATSLDGRIADAAGASRWISNMGSRAFVAMLRGCADAIVVGRETVVRDDPSLRIVPDGATRTSPDRGGGPLRVVFDSLLRTPTTVKVVATARWVPTLFIAVRGADASRREALEASGAQVAEVAAGADGRVSVVEAFRELHRRGARRVMLEAGGALQAACMRAGVVDHVAAFVAPVVIGGAGPTPFEGDGWPIAAARRLEDVRVSPIVGDALIEGYWPLT